MSAALIERLVQRYTPPAIPPCNVCGAALAVAAIGGGMPRRYACSTQELGNGKPMDWQHYPKSQWDDRRQDSDSDVLALIELYQALISPAPTASAEPMTFEKFFAEAEWTGLTLEALVPALKARLTEMETQGAIVKHTDGGHEWAARQGETVQASGAVDAATSESERRNISSSDAQERAELEKRGQQRLVD